MRLTLGARGAASPQEAWERYADLGAWSSWSPQVSRVRTGGPRRIVPGLAGSVDGLPLAGRPLLRVAFEVVCVDEAGRRWGWAVVPARVVADLPRVLGRFGALRLDHAVEPCAGGCRTHLVMTGRAPVVLGYALPALAALRRLVRARGRRPPRRRPR